MMRFFTQVHPRMVSRGSNIMRHSGCLTLMRGNLVPCGTTCRTYVEKTDKDHPQKRGAREEKEQMQMPGFVNPQTTFNEEGYFTQKARHQIEEHKKKKDKPSLHNPEGRQ